MDIKLTYLQEKIAVELATNVTDSKTQETFFHNKDQCISK